MSHPEFTTFCAVLAAAVTAATGDCTARERAWIAARTFTYYVSAVVGGSWLMHAING